MTRAVSSAASDVYKRQVYIGSAWRDISYVGLDGEKHPFTVRTVYEIVERNIDKHGQYLLPADVEINM